MIVTLSNPYLAVRRVVGQFTPPHFDSDYYKANTWNYVLDISTFIIPTNKTHVIGEFSLVLVRIRIPFILSYIQLGICAMY